MSTVNDTADNVYQATREAANKFRRRSSNVKDYAGDEMRSFLSDVEDLVDRLSDVGDAEVVRLRQRVAGTLSDVRRTVGDASDTMRERARQAAVRTDEYVHASPWTAIGLAAVVGLIVGVGAAAAAGRR